MLVMRSSVSSGRKRMRLPVDAEPTLHNAGARTATRAARRRSWGRWLSDERAPRCSCATNTTAKNCAAIRAANVSALKRCCMELLRGHRIDQNGLDLLVRADDEDAAHRLIVGRRALGASRR